jgi:hypothetical protein
MRSKEKYYTIIMKTTKKIKSKKPKTHKKIPKTHKKQHNRTNKKPNAGTLTLKQLNNEITSLFILSPNEQIEHVLELLRNAKEKSLNEKLKDRKNPNKLVLIDTNKLNGLNYWNYSQTLDNSSLGNQDDMRNIMHMLKNPEHKFKKSNKEIWQKNIMDFIYKTNRTSQFAARTIHFPKIKEVRGPISLKDLSIHILEHRLDLLKWNTKQTKPQEEDTGVKSAGVDQDEYDIVINLYKKNVTPEDWDADDDEEETFGKNEEAESEREFRTM